MFLSRIVPYFKHGNSKRQSKRKVEKRPCVPAPAPSEPSSSWVHPRVQGPWRRPQLFSPSNGNSQRLRRAWNNQPDLESSLRVVNGWWAVIGCHLKASVSSSKFGQTSQPWNQSINVRRALPAGTQAHHREGKTVRAHRAMPFRSKQVCFKAKNKN